MYEYIHKRSYPDQNGTRSNETVTTYRSEMPICQLMGIVAEEFDDVVDLKAIIHNGRVVGFEIELSQGYKARHELASY